MIGRRDYWWSLGKIGAFTKKGNKFNYFICDTSDTKLYEFMMK